MFNIKLTKNKTFVFCFFVIYFALYNSLSKVTISSYTSSSKVLFCNLVISNIMTTEINYTRVLLFLQYPRVKDKAKFIIKISKKCVLLLNNN